MASVDWPDFAVLLARPSWMADAACIEHPGLPWAGGHRDPPTVVVEAMRAVCSACLVAGECAGYAAEHGLNAEPDGMWAGATPAERRAVRPRGR